MAEASASLGADLADMVTPANLQSGVASAIPQAGLPQGGQAGGLEVVRRLRGAYT
jgi:hypothetical protein